MSLSSAVKCASGACLVLALFEMPDDFYKVLRFVVLAGAIFTVLDVQKSSLSQNWKTALTLAFSAIGIIFNPILPLDMERSEWAWFDLLAALMFSGMLGYEKWAEIGAWWRRITSDPVTRDLQEGRKEELPQVPSGVLANYFQAPLLFALRVYFFWQLFLAGRGKLFNIGRTAEFFSSLNIPLPIMNAILAGATECIGGLLLVVGFASRLTAIPVAFTMIVAYITADYEALTSIFSEPDKFVAAAPFPFLLAALVVLAFGPGALSIDALIKRFARASIPGALRF